MNSRQYIISLEMARIACDRMPDVLLDELGISHEEFTEIESILIEMVEHAGAHRPKNKGLRHESSI